MIGKKTALSTAAAVVANTGNVVYVRNADATISIFLGGADVTSAGANGIELKPADGIIGPITVAGDLYAVAASGTPSLELLIA